MVLIATFNVNGLRQTIKRKAIFYFLKQKQIDIILLQETHSLSADEILWKYEWGGDILFAHGDSNSKGVAILIIRNLNYRLGKLLLDPCGRFNLAKTDFDKKKIILENVYAPNKDDNVFLMAFFVTLLNFQKQI